MEIVTLPAWSTKWDYLTKWQAISSSKLATSVYCHACNKHCSLLGPDICSTGTPCTPWSLAGSRAGLESQENYVFLLWCHFHQHWQTPLMVHENVPGFPFALAEANMSHAWHISELVIDTTQTGLGLMRRTRQYLVFMHKDCAT
eukprot:14839384-Alexandrium_andersonii.AAC.1